MRLVFEDVRAFTKRILIALRKLERHSFCCVLYKSRSKRMGGIFTT